MDNFINLAKQGYQAYNESQSGGASATGGQQYNSPDNSGGQYQGGGRQPVNFNHDDVVNNAQSNHPGADSSLFSNAAHYLNQNQDQHNQPVNEDDVQDAHRQAYQGGGAGNLSAGAMGSAAALQALQKFTSGGGSGGGGGSSQLISLAMAEATKLFDQSGGPSSGSKQDVVNSASMTVMKLLVQSKLSGMTGGGNSGGLGSLAGLASKFV